MSCFLPVLDEKRIIYGLITLRVIKKQAFKRKKKSERITLKEIIIVSESRSVIEVEQSLKQSQSRHNQGLSFMLHILFICDLLQ